MGIPNRQIGWSTKSNLLWQISKQLERLTCVTAGGCSTTTTTTEAQTRSGVFSQVVPSTITQSLGDRVIDVSIIPYMRERGILFTCSDFKPTTELFGFFDNMVLNSKEKRKLKNKLSIYCNELLTKC